MEERERRRGRREERAAFSLFSERLSTAIDVLTNAFNLQHLIVGESSSGPNEDPLSIKTLCSKAFEEERRLPLFVITGREATVPVWTGRRSLDAPARTMINHSSRSSLPQSPLRVKEGENHLERSNESSYYGSQV